MGDNCSILPLRLIPGFFSNANKIYDIATKVSSSSSPIPGIPIWPTGVACLGLLDCWAWSGASGWGFRERSRYAVIQLSEHR